MVLSGMPAFTMRLLLATYCHRECSGIIRIASCKIEYSKKETRCPSRHNKVFDCSCASLTPADVERLLEKRIQCHQIGGGPGKVHVRWRCGRENRHVTANQGGFSSLLGPIIVRALDRPRSSSGVHGRLSTVARLGTVPRRTRRPAPPSQAHRSPASLRMCDYQGRGAIRPILVDKQTPAHSSFRLALDAPADRSAEPSESRY